MRVVSEAKDNFSLILENNTFINVENIFDPLWTCYFEVPQITINNLNIINSTVTTFLSLSDIKESII